MPSGQKPPQRIIAADATAENTASIIFLHGYGDDSDGWTNIAQQFQSANKLPHLNWIFPNAPYSPDSGTTAWFEPTTFSTIPVGRSTNATSNPDDSDEDEDNDQEGILKSVTYLCDLVQAEVDRGIPLKRIVVGGFSQGCCVSLVAALGKRFGGKIAGIIGLSGALPRGKAIKNELEGFIATTGEDHAGPMRVFLGHGTRDFLVPMRIFHETKERVEKLVGEDVFEAHEYEGMGHVTCGKEFMDMCAFLERVVPA